MLVLLAAAVVVAAAAPARAQREITHSDVWSDPNPGVRYLRRTTSLPSIIHVLVVDLSHDGVRVVTTRHADRWQSVSDYAQQQSLVGAINGGFWSGLARPEGVQVADGEPWPGAADDEEFGFFAIGRDGRAFVSPPHDLRGMRGLQQAVSGRPLLVRAGRVDFESLEEVTWSGVRAPRTAVGASEDGRTVYLVVCDGRQAHSRGMDLHELARLFVELGAHMAINLDGGGSSAMFVRNLGGIVGSPSGGRWQLALGIGAEEDDGEDEPPAYGSKTKRMRDGSRQHYVRGIEREVMNHIGVIAPEPELPSAAPASSPLDVRPEPEPPGNRAIVLPPRPPLVRLGTFREVLFPAVYATAVAIPAVAALFAWRKRRRRARA